MAKKNRQQLDLEAREEASVGANKRKFHVRDLSQVQPKTQSQRDTFYQWAEDKSMLLTGSAGTGKTFLSMFLALREVLDNSTPYNRLVIIRSIVPSRELGFLPGLLEDKVAPYEEPYRAICNDLFPYAKTYDNLKKNGYLEFETTSFLRGRSLNSSIILVDESQNMTEQELDTVMTRVGENSKIIFIGDSKQTDLNKKNDKSGFENFTSILKKMNSIETVCFTAHDIVRSGLVKEYILTKESV